MGGRVFIWSITQIYKSNITQIHKVNRTDSNIKSMIQVILLLIWSINQSTLLLLNSLNLIYRVKENSLHLNI